MRNKRRNRSLIRREIELIKNKNGYTTADEIVAHLRSKTTRFSRVKTDTLAAAVKETLPCDSDSHTSNKSRKRGVKKEDRRSIKMEEKKYVSRVATSSSGSVSDDSDEIMEEESDVFDVTKNMLRESYKTSNVTKSANKGLINLSSKKRTRSTDETDDDEVLDATKSKKFAKNVELEKAVRSVKKRDFVVGKNEKGTSKEVTDGPRFKDLGGMSEIVKSLNKKLIFPLLNPPILREIGIKYPIKGILLKGPPGCGKTKLAHAIANQTGLPFYKIAATELVSGVSGASEENIRELFAKAYRTAPSIVFIDEIDAIGSKRENQHREMERRIVTQLMTCMDESHKAIQSSDGDSDASQKSDYVLVIGATNRPDALDSALRRPGRFDREITLSVPDEKARLEILSVLVTNLRVEGEGSFDLVKIARSTPGFVGADLTALVNEAGNVALERIYDRIESELSKDPLDGPLSAEERENLREHICITLADFEEAVTLVQPSSKREGFSSVPNVKWEDVGGLPELRKDFDDYIVDPIKYPDSYEKKDLDFGFLLYGPPGCGKTLIAKAVANEAGANFIHIKGPELLNKYVGESELAIRTLFSRARTCAPCIVFFDEVDALTANGDTEGGGVVNRLLRQLMIELSGSDERKNLFVIGATNRPEVMDRALFRDERFGKLVHVTLPNADARGSILTALARERKIDASVDLIAIGRDEACKNLSGADLSRLMKVASMLAAKERRRLAAESSSSDAISWTIKKEHFDQALKKISPSVSDEQKQRYYCFEQSLEAA